jgi:chromosomal replication initiator protein
MPQFALEAWIGPLVPRSSAPEDSGPDARLTLGCPTAFHRDRVRERFLPEIERCAALEAGGPVAVDLVVAPPLRVTAPAPAQPPRETSAPAPAARVNPARAPAQSDRGNPPDSQREFPYRFDNFVVGTCNALAREASVAVARRAQRALNPLVLTSAQGLGKTHLARAIVNEARQNGEARVIYASAEGFTNDFTHSIQSRRADEFKRRFRHGCRLLVIEDVQFLDARKRATQLELFHTICHLLDVGASVVLTADRLPRDIEGLDPRLRSKLSSGLVAELEAPDAIVRREILRQKAADGGVRLPDACRELIVESVRGSVRDLEGVLIQLVAMASLLKRSIDAELTLVALRKLAPIAEVRRALEIGDVVAAVAAYFKQPPDALAARSRRRDVLLPRQLAMYLAHRYTSASLSQIGAALGRDHSAAANAVRKIERRILEHAPLRYQVEALCARLDGMVGERRE